MPNNEEQQKWWNGLTKEVQDSINHVACHKKIFNLEECYKKFGNTVK